MSAASKLDDALDNLIKEMTTNMRGTPEAAAEEAIQAAHDDHNDRKSERQAEKEAAIATLEVIGGKTFAEEDVVFQGTKLVIPEKLSLKEALIFLQEKIEEDEQDVQFSRKFNFRPWDGANATMTALKRAFGMMQQKSIMTMFGPQPPQMISIATDVGEETQVPWGAITIPSLPGVTLYTGHTSHPEYGLIFYINGTGPRKHRFAVEGIFNLVQEELETNSIYRGKAFDAQTEPEFLDLSGVDPDKVVYSADVLEHLNANVWSLLENSEALRKLDVPLKRAVLLEGPYGTGKTLGAYLTAKKARENGWTFIYVRPGRDDFQSAMATARLYQPSVVFFEDVDTIGGADGGEDHVSTMLDLFDGVKAKGTEIICVLTTNHVEAIHKGMLRPGRLDAIIHIGALDAEGIARLVQAVSPEGSLSPDIDWSAVSASMEGFMPAFVREASDRAVRYVLARNGGTLTTIITEDLTNAANGLRPQLDLMNDAPEFANTDTITQALASVIENKVTDVINRSGMTINVKQNKDRLEYAFRVAEEELINRS